MSKIYSLDLSYKKIGYYDFEAIYHKISNKMIVRIKDSVNFKVYQRVYCENDLNSISKLTDFLNLRWLNMEKLFYLLHLLIKKYLMRHLKINLLVIIFLIFNLEN